MAHAIKHAVIHISRVRFITGCPLVNLSNTYVVIATTAVSKAMRNGASAGKYDCGANNKINVKVIRAQNGMALSEIWRSAAAGASPRSQIGRASCRERV